MQAHERHERRLAWALAAPALGLSAAVTAFPLLWVLWDSFHRHDLRMPWLGHPFVGLENYAELLSDARFWEAASHTLFFVAVTVSAELLLGLLLALGLHAEFRGRGWARTAALLPWALPTVVAALVWRFLFEGRGGFVNVVLLALGILERPPVWFADPVLAWVPLLLADIWKATPFVALLLLAGLQGIDPALYEAARVDGASRWEEFRHVTLPLLRPALLVALVFRTLDALRVFDLVYVLTNGGPGTATEPLALYTFRVLFQNLRFGLGSALSFVLFALSFALALVYVHTVGRGVLGGGR
ncbi:MAG: ABC transporter permease [Candidatus Binatia bacterium]|nr:MAG: ABC transporter permease [Candidatus Binatia bacterium]